MSQTQSESQSKPNTYKWVNRNEFEHNGIQQLGDKVVTSQSEQDQAQNVAQLFNAMQKSSNDTLLHIDDQKKEMRLYNTPKNGSGMLSTDGKSSYVSTYMNSKNRFNYLSLWSYHFTGNKGFSFLAKAHTKIFNCDSHFYWNATLNNRLDNAFVSEDHQVGFAVTKSNFLKMDKINLMLARESQDKSLSFYDEQAKKNYKYGTTHSEKQAFKQTNLWGVIYDIQKHFLTLSGFAAIDFGNRSFHNNMYIKAQKEFEVNEALKVNLMATIGNIWGQNYRKNSMFVPNQRKWMGLRAKQYSTVKAQIYFTKFPYLYLVNWNTFLYGQVWSAFSDEASLNTTNKFLGEYGIGISSKDGRFKFNFSLFSCSSDRKQGVFGPIKFSF